MKEPARGEVEALAALFERGKVAVLTGAGVSTESGIPDYRGPETQRRARNPIQYREFLRSNAARRRYWARSTLGFPRMSAALPNEAHHALAELERADKLTGLITQNVDGLHLVAGSEQVVELHGALREVLCLTCGSRVPRSALQAELERQNPGFRESAVELAPDGDAELPEQLVSAFRVVDCAACQGPLKPHVVFFGENVPKERVDRAFALVQDASALVVVGSSLTVFSGLRFVHAAAKLGLPIAIVTYGTTRGDGLANLRIEASTGRTLAALAQRLAEGS